MSCLGFVEAGMGLDCRRWCCRLGGSSSRKPMRLAKVECRTEGW
jgi:hypothetical protein